MSILKHILSPFVEFKEKDKSADQPEEQTIPEKENASPPLPPASAVTGTTSVTTPSAAGSGQPADAAKYQQHFEDLIEEANQKNPVFQGTDFKEFTESKVDVETIADEATKYRTAFNVLKRTGLTKQKLLTTGQEYVNLIDKDLREFENVFTQQYRTDVEGKEQLLQRKREELQLLNEKITALNKEMQQLAQDITQSKETLTSNRAAFVSAGEAKKGEIRAELQKIDQYFT